MHAGLTSVSTSGSRCGVCERSDGNGEVDGTKSESKPSATEGSGRGAARRQATATAAVAAVVAVTREEMEDLVVELVTVRTNEEREEREQEREEARDVIVTEKSGRARSPARDSEGATKEF